MTYRTGRVFYILLCGGTGWGVGAFASGRTSPFMAHVFGVERYALPEVRSLTSHPTDCRVEFLAEI